MQTVSACSFIKSGSTKIMQLMATCMTCKQTGITNICSYCAETCHQHHILEVKSGNKLEQKLGICDCGMRNNCKNNTIYSRNFIDFSDKKIGSSEAKINNFHRNTFDFPHDITGSMSSLPMMTAPLTSPGSMDNIPGISKKNVYNREQQIMDRQFSDNIMITLPASQTMLGGRDSFNKATRVELNPNNRIDNGTINHDKIQTTKFDDITASNKYSVIDEEISEVPCKDEKCVAK